MRTFKNLIFKANFIGIGIFVSFSFIFIHSCKSDKKSTQGETVAEAKENVIGIIAENMDFQMPGP